MDTKRIELEEGIVAVVTYQDQMPEPFWMFGFQYWVYSEIDGEHLYPAWDGDGYIQVCLLGGQDPDEVLFKGIREYGLPVPRDGEIRVAYEAWLQDDEGVSDE